MYAQGRFAINGSKSSSDLGGPPAWGLRLRSSAPRAGDQAVRSGSRPGSHRDQRKQKLVGHAVPYRSRWPKASGGNYVRGHAPGRRHHVSGVNVPIKAMQYPVPSLVATRSRSPERRRQQEATAETGALPPLRRGAPSRRADTRARDPQLWHEEDRQEALVELTSGIYADSTTASVASRRRCVERLLFQWGLRPAPINAAKVRALGASLKRGGFRSYGTVLSQYRVDAERRGEEITGVLARTFTDVARSCGRGLGPSTQAMPLPFERLQDLPASPHPWLPGGPIGGRNAMVTGSWWMMREMELSTTRARLVAVGGGEHPTISIQLAATKTDTRALGVSRSHGCICQPGRWLASCPVHAILDQQILLARFFPNRAGDLSLPLFPDIRGQAVSKTAMTATIRHAAEWLRVPLASADGKQKVTGHSLRPTGAQGLARLGVDTWAIELLGRWSSKTVQRYVREAAVEQAATQARAAMIRMTWQQVAAATSEVLQDPAGATDAAIRDALVRVAPGALASWRCSLLTEVRDTLARAAPTARAASPAPASSSSTSSSSAEPARDSSPEAPEPPAPEGGNPKEVSHVRRGRYRRHAIQVGPPELNPARWTTFCGWRFGVSGASRAASAEHPWCLRCARAVGAVPEPAS